VKRTKETNENQISMNLGDVEMIEETTKKRARKEEPVMVEEKPIKVKKEKAAKEKKDKEKETKKEAIVKMETEPAKEKKPRKRSEILNLDNAGTIGAWGYEIANFLNDMTADNIIPYLTEAEVNGVSNIGAGAFLYFICLRNINISDSVTKIDANASSYCFSLNNFDFKNINYIGNRAFSGTNLKNVIIPDGITTIGVYTFSDSKIESIDLNDIEIVSEAMFIDCDNLINVELGDNTTAIGENAFETCDALQSIDLKNVNSIGSLAFIDCSNLKTIKIKASALSEVGDSVFKNIAAGSKIYVLNQDVKNALEGKYDTSKTTVEIKTLEEMENL